MNANVNIGVYSEADIEMKYNVVWVVVYTYIEIWYSETSGWYRYWNIMMRNCAPGRTNGHAGVTLGVPEGKTPPTDGHHHYTSTTQPSPIPIVFILDSITNKRPQQCSSQTNNPRDKDLQLLIYWCKTLPGVGRGQLRKGLEGWGGRYLWLRRHHTCCGQRSQGKSQK